MKSYVFGVAVLLGAFCLGLPSYAQDQGTLIEHDEEGPIVEDTTPQFKEQDKQALQNLAKSSFFMDLQTYAAAAKATDVADIKALLTMPNLGPGDPAIKYDVVLQPGHYLRKKGAGKNLGTSGKEVSEQELVAFITANVAKYLIDNKANVLVVSADDWKSGLNADIFLSIHADGSENKCSTGPSLGYGKDSSLLGMHGLAFALATSMGQSYSDFQKDNFTVNLRGYYMFKHVKIPTKGFSGVLEVGELTCEPKEKALIQNALLIAKNVGVALKASHEIIKEPLEVK